MSESTASFSVELLAKAHQRDRFDCGVDALNRFIHTRARQDMDRGAAVVCVAVHANAPAQVAGYYSLASAAVVVDAKDDSATAFYARYDFMPFPDQPRRLFIAMKTVEQLG